MGDFNGYVGVTPEALMSPHACTDEAAWKAWDDLVIHLPPWVSKALVDERIIGAVKFWIFRVRKIWLF